MVLTDKVGKERPFLRGLLLTVLTFGLYGIYWLYKAHDELYKQFELQHDKRDEATVWLIMGLLLPPLKFVYEWTFVSNVRYLRQRLGLYRSISPAAFVSLDAFAALANVIALVVLNFQVAALGDDPTEEAMMDAILGAVGYLAIAFVVAAIARIIAFFLLQSDINEVWRAYDARMRALTEPPTAAPSSVGTEYTYWGDLSPNEGQRATGPEGQSQRPEPSPSPSPLPSPVALREELADVDAKLGRLAHRLADGSVDNAAYATAREELLKQRTRIEKGITGAGQREAEKRRTGDDVP